MPNPALVRYLYDVSVGAISNGTTLPDDTGTTGNDLISANGGDTIDGIAAPGSVTGSGIRFLPTDGAQVLQSTTSQDISDALDGTNEWSCLFAMDLQDSMGSGGTPHLYGAIFGLAVDTTTSGSQFSVGSRAGNARIYGTVNRSVGQSGNEEHQRWTAATDWTGYHVYVLNVKLDEVGLDKMELFQDGVLQSATTQSPSNGSTFVDVANLRVSVGNLVNASADRGLELDLFFTSLYDANLTAQEISDSNTALQADCNTDPFAPVSSPADGAGLFNF